MFFININMTYIWHIHMTYTYDNMTSNLTYTWLCESMSCSSTLDGLGLLTCEKRWWICYLSGNMREDNPQTEVWLERDAKCVSYPILSPSYCYTCTCASDFVFKVIVLATEISMNQPIQLQKLSNSDKDYLPAFPFWQAGAIVDNWLSVLSIGVCLWFKNYTCDKFCILLLQC